MNPTDRYLKLLKLTLTHGLWPPSLVPLVRFQHALPAWKKAFLRLLNPLLNLKRVQLVKEMPYTAEDVAEGRTVPIDAHTMIGLKRLNQLHEAVETVLTEEIEGDLIEAGVWRGGACVRRQTLWNHLTLFLSDTFLPVTSPA
jgi:hypothetical protein